MGRVDAQNQVAEGGQMTDAEMNRKIAAWMGWTRIRLAEKTDERNGWHGMVGLPPGPNQRISKRVWSYTRDLNLCAEMEGKLAERGLQREYVKALIGIMGGRTSPNQILELEWSLISATAQQRCEAALKVIEKEKT